MNKKPTRKSRLVPSCEKEHTAGESLFVPSSSLERKSLPIATGVIDYFPRTILALASVSKAGNDQHNPGKPLHWDRTKSKDHADCLMRHFIDRGKTDTDKQLHSVKVAWRAMALAETELEQRERNKQKGRG